MNGVSINCEEIFAFYYVAGQDHKNYRTNLFDDDILYLSAMTHASQEQVKSMCEEMTPAN